MFQFVVTRTDAKRESRQINFNLISNDDTAIVLYNAIALGQALLCSSNHISADFGYAYCIQQRVSLHRYAECTPTRWAKRYAQSQGMITTRSDCRTLSVYRAQRRRPNLPRRLVSDYDSSLSVSDGECEAFASEKAFNSTDA